MIAAEAREPYGVSPRAGKTLVRAETKQKRNDNYAEHEEF